MKHRTAFSVASLAFGMLAMASVGCSSSGDKAPNNAADGPGSTVISDVIACTTDSDCKSGEACGQGFCQMKRCASPSYSSVPPLGKYGYAFVDRALLVENATTTMQIFSAYAKGGTEIATDAPPLDITGGNLTGTRPEPVAFVSSGAQSITVLGADGGVPQRIALNFPPTRIAAGDVDGDGIDELVALGTTQYALCSAVTGICKNGTLGSPATDVAVGDVTGDGNADIVFLGNHTIVTIDVAASKVDSEPVTAALVNVAVGDLDGDGVAEIIATEKSTGITNLFTADKLHVLHLNGTVVSDDSVTDLQTQGDTSLDVVYAMQDNKPVAAVLSAGNIYVANVGPIPGTLQTFTYASKTLTNQASVTLDGYDSTRLAASDVNGRSAAVRVKGDPKLLVGPPVPLAVLTLPPYSGQHSAGPSSVTMGTGTDTNDSDSHGQSSTTTASLNLSAGITLGKGISGSIGAFVNYTWGHTQSHSQQTSTSLSIGASYSVNADPTVDGYNSGGVVLAGGCFHQYDYVVDDPQNVLNSTDTAAQGFATFVPVGGETTLWSTARYNALVDALGGSLPKVTIQPKLGNVDSYPTTPTTIDGQPIPDVDNVFMKTPPTRTSDVGTVGFSLSSSVSQTNTTATSFNFGTTVGGNASLNLVAVSFSGSYSVDNSYSIDQSYSVTVGSSASFSGQVSPVRDDPSTPANEASLYGYSFTPYVYRHHYTDASGADRAFYAVTYTTGD